MPNENEAPASTPRRDRGAAAPKAEADKADSSKLVRRVRTVGVIPEPAPKKPTR